MNRIEKINEYLQSAPKDNFLRHALALEYVKTGEEEKAKALFESILNEFPDYIGSYYHLGKLLERTNDTASAVKWYEKGMEAAKAQKDMHAYSELQSAYEDLVY